MIRDDGSIEISHQAELFPNIFEPSQLSELFRKLSSSLPHKELIKRHNFEERNISWWFSPSGFWLYATTTLLISRICLINPNVSTFMWHIKRRFPSEIETVNYKYTPSYVFKLLAVSFPHVLHNKTKKRETESERPKCQF